MEKRLNLAPSGKDDVVKCLTHGVHDPMDDVPPLIGPVRHVTKEGA